MKILKYRLMTEVNHGTEDNPNIVQTFKDCVVKCKNGTFDDAYALSLSEAYNGEVTVEDDGKPEPVIPPTNEELAAENKRLKAQMEMQAQNITFLENCLLEMGDIVYA